MQTILAVDDELSIRESYRLILQDNFNLILAENGRRALAMLEETHVDVMLLDLMMPGMSGMEVLKTLAEREDAPPVIVVTALNSVKSAVDAMKSAADEYLIKPFDIEELRIAVSRTLSKRRVALELEHRRESDMVVFESIIGDSPALKDVLSKAKQAMAVDSTVMVTGESGTGKDLLARAIHTGGKRAKNPFVALSCCTIPNQLVESELFGHEKGSFTGAERRQIGKLQVADGGTLFLDEIGEMPLEAQAKLLRVLQDRRFYPIGSTKVIEVDIRFVCATNRDLLEATRKSLFREDLYYRVNVLPIRMPSLRDRRQDIPMLLAHFIAKQKPRLNARVKEFSPKALALMTSYAWPGNVRELENTTERILVHHGQESTIKPEHLHDILPDIEQPTTVSFDAFEGLPLEEATQRLEKHLILSALERSHHVQARAAAMLGTTRRILKYKMDQLDIDAETQARAS